MILFDLRDKDLALVFDAAKRCGLIHYKDVGDWFAAYSPKSGGVAEGTWAHWCNFAAMILAHPATEKVAPHLYQPGLEFDPSMYAGGPVLSADDLREFSNVDGEKE